MRLSKLEPPIEVARLIEWFVDKKRQQGQRCNQLLALLNGVRRTTACSHAQSGFLSKDHPAAKAALLSNEKMAPGSRLENIRRPTSGRSHVHYGVAGENVSLGRGSLVLASAAPEVARRYTVMFAEYPAEMREVIEAPGEGDLADMTVRENRRRQIAMTS